MTYRVDIQPADLIALFDLRGDAQSLPDLLERADLTCPEDVTGIVAAGDARVVRTGPRRALLVAPIEHEQQWQQKLNRACADIFANATCVSDMYRGVQISGENALDVIAQVTPLNLHEFSAGHGTCTDLFATSGFLLRDAERQITLFFEHSYFDYALERLGRCALRESSG